MDGTSPTLKQNFLDRTLNVSVSYFIKKSSLNYQNIVLTDSLLSASKDTIHLTMLKINTRNINFTGNNVVHKMNVPHIYLVEERVCAW